MNLIRMKSSTAVLALTITFLVSCKDDDTIEVNTNELAEQEVKTENLSQVFNKFMLEDRTDGSVDDNPSEVSNGYVKMLRDNEDGKYYLSFTDFNNINQSIDLKYPNIVASKFAVFLTTAGAALDTQSNFDDGDLPIYIGTIDENGTFKLRLTPTAVTNNSITIGSKTIRVKNSKDIVLTSKGDVKYQKSTGSRSTWYDWVVLHPFEGDNLRPTSYPGIVADLDAAHQLDQNVTMVYNKFMLQDRTDSDTDNNPSAIKNYDASIVQYNEATYIRFNKFQNIEQSIDLQYPNIEASKFAVFLTTAGAALGTQNGFDEGDRPVYIGELTTNGFNDIALKPGVGNDTGSVMLGANHIEVKTNANIVLENGFVKKQISTGSSAVWYDWIVLHPFEGENLRPIGYSGIVADLDGANELEENK